MSNWKWVEPIFKGKQWSDGDQCSASMHMTTRIASISFLKRDLRLGKLSEVVVLQRQIQSMTSP